MKQDTNTEFNTQFKMTITTTLTPNSDAQPNSKITIIPCIDRVESNITCCIAFNLSPQTWNRP